MMRRTLLAAAVATRSVAARRYCHLQQPPSLLCEDGPQIKRNFSPVKASDRKPLLPPPLPENVGKVCLVLDMDETLVHTSFGDKPMSPKNKGGYDIISPVENSTEVAYVKKRPFVDEFLRFCSPLFEVVIFTAATSEYANPLLDQLDPDRQLLAHRLFREHCTVDDHWYVKDLSLLGRPLNKICIIDDSWGSYDFQPHNGLRCTGWYGRNQSDTELRDFQVLLAQIAKSDNVWTHLDEFHRQLALQNEKQAKQGQLNLSPHPALAENEKQGH